MPTENQTITTATENRGAFITTTYVGREMKVLAVSVGELRTISTLNSQATAFYSVGSAFLSFALAIWINAVFYVQLTSVATLAVWFAAPACVFMAIVFFCLGRSAATKRASTLQEIQNQTLSK
jgi:hypothetical protein